jgi:exopolysaccharide/PEP-CTERM locus tyrosine autokinase
VGIIEQAAQRLEELRRSGIDVPRHAVPVGPAAAGTAAGDLPARAASRFEEVRRATSPTQGRVEQATAGPSPEPASSPSTAVRVEIDLARLGAMGFVTPEAPRSQIADEFRVVKRQPLANMDDKAAVPVRNANLIMVTSALPDEGKTFVAINLAISLSMELNKQVLLVDADVARPSVMSRLGIDRSAGFLDVLADPAHDMSNVLLRTNIESLTVLPGGAPRPLATEMIASETTIGLLNEMADRYADRIIVFDAPPLLPSTESRVLATHMGQVILVVAAEQTAQKTVMQALAAIASCPVVLPLLNKASYSEVGNFYGYYGPMER